MLEKSKQRGTHATAKQQAGDSGRSPNHSHERSLHDRSMELRAPRGPLHGPWRQGPLHLSDGGGEYARLSDGYHAGPWHLSDGGGYYDGGTHYEGSQFAHSSGFKYGMEAVHRFGGWGCCCCPDSESEIQDEPEGTTETRTKTIIKEVRWRCQLWSRRRGCSQCASRCL